MAGNYQNSILKRSNGPVYFGLTDTAEYMSIDGATITSETADTDIIYKPNGTGILKLQASTANTPLSFQLLNYHDSSGADSRVAIKTGGASGGDPYILTGIVGTQYWTYGLDNSDADKFVISKGDSLGTDNVMEITTDGAVNFPMQPAFNASIVSASLTNVTGSGTVYSIPYDTVDTNIGSDFDGTTFTASISGKYYFNLVVTASDIASGADVGQITITTSNRTYQGYDRNPYATSQPYLTKCSFDICALVDMDSGDTAYSTIAVGGLGSDTVDVFYQSATHFSGKLIC